MTNNTPNTPDEQQMQADDTTGLALFDEEQAEHTIRREWHDGRWFFSVIDVVGVLTGSPTPRRYWVDMKRNVQEGGYDELLTRCRQLKLTAPDGKLRETDCADFATIVSLVYHLPALRRRRDSETLDQGATTTPCGIYAIINTITQEQYIGSSYDMVYRFSQHKAMLRHGKHHALRLQKAWDAYGENAFVFVVLEELARPEQLAVVEQRYLDAERPAYNGTPIANNQLVLKPLAEERLPRLLLWLYDIHSSTTSTPLFRTLREAILYGVVAPGPNFHLLIEAEASGIDVWTRFGVFIQRQSEKMRQEVQYVQ